MKLGQLTKEPSERRTAARYDVDIEETGDRQSSLVNRVSLRLAS
jgi:hypothetical protein